MNTIEKSFGRWNWEKDCKVTPEMQNKVIQWNLKNFMSIMLSRVNNGGRFPEPDELEIPVYLNGKVKLLPEVREFYEEKGWEFREKNSILYLIF